MLGGVALLGCSSCGPYDHADALMVGCFVHLVSCSSAIDPDATNDVYACSIGCSAHIVAGLIPSLCTIAPICPYVTLYTLTLYGAGTRYACAHCVSYPLLVRVCHYAPVMPCYGHSTRSHALTSPTRIYAHARSHPGTRRSYYHPRMPCAHSPACSMLPCPHAPTTPSNNRTLGCIMIGCT